MACPGDLGTSDNPPGGESHLSAQDVSERYASDAACKIGEGEEEGRRRMEV